MIQRHGEQGVGRLGTWPGAALEAEEAAWRPFQADRKGRSRQDGEPRVDGSGRGCSGVKGCILFFCSEEMQLYREGKGFEMVLEKRGKGCGIKDTGFKEWGN